MSPKECTHDPRQYLGMPIGMYHCPDCGVMVIAGMNHPKSDPCESDGDGN